MVEIYLTCFSYHYRNTKNKIEVVNVQEAERGENTQSDSRRISTVHSEESHTLPGSTEQGQARRRTQRSSGDGVVTLAPIDDPDLSHV